MLRKLISAAALGLAAIGAHAAPLLGSSVNFQYYFPDLGSPYAGSANGIYVVGAGVEIGNMVDNQATMDVTASQIIVDFGGNSGFSGADFNGWVLSDVLADIDAFASVTIDAATNFAGFDASRISFTDDSISVNFTNLVFSSDTLLVLNIGTRDGGQVPEPGVLALAGLALLGAGVARRRR